MPHLTPENIKPPSPFGLVKEVFGILELARLLLNFPNLVRQPRGNGEPVLVIPGYGTTDKITAVLRLYLKYLNYTPLGWGLGRNDGNIQKLLAALSKKFFPKGVSPAGPLHVVGWSLGGYLARELAREYPDQVRQVVTFGTPVIGGPKYTVTAGWYKQKGYDLDEIEKVVADRYAQTLDVPVTAIYSKNDRVVAWQACIDIYSPNVEHIEVNSTHLGFGFAPDVYRIIAERLAQTKQLDDNP
jgi:pimeloyl-ACP methyl ester carboxylesterase